MFRRRVFRPTPGIKIGNPDKPQKTFKLLKQDAMGLAAADAAHHLAVRLARLGLACSW